MRWPPALVIGTAMVGLMLAVAVLAALLGSLTQRAPSQK